jgi:hypothetical protein
VSFSFSLSWIEFHVWSLVFSETGRLRAAEVRGKKPAKTTFHTEMASLCIKGDTPMAQQVMLLTVLKERCMSKKQEQCSFFPVNSTGSHAERLLLPGMLRDIAYDFGSDSLGVRRSDLFGLLPSARSTSSNRCLMCSMEPSTPADRPS